MKKTNCWYNLNIDITDAFKSDWVWPEPKNKSLLILSESNTQNIFNTRFMDYMSSIDVPVNFALYFNSLSKYKTDFAHIDMTCNNTTQPWPWAINWVLGGENSELVWYETPIGTNRHEDVANTPYMPFPIEGLVKIDNCNVLAKAILIRTDVPHAAWVTDDQRWCMSIRSSLKYNTWDSIVTHLRDLNLLIERN